MTALAALLLLGLPQALPAQEPAAVPPPTAAPPAQPLTLKDAIAIALAHNPALQTAGGQVAEAEARAGEARAARGNQLSLHAEYSYENPIPSIRTSLLTPPLQLANPETFLTTLTARRVLYSSGRLEALVRQATDLAHAAEATSQRTCQDVIFQATRAFEILVAAQREREVAQQTLDAAEAHLKDAQVRFEARAAAQFDVLRAQVDVENARQLVISAISDIQLAKDALLQALGLDRGDFTAVEQTPPAITLPAVDMLLTEAYTHRPELLAFGYEISAADAAIKAARRERYPTIGLAANYQFASPTSPTLINQLTVALQLDVILIDAGLTKYRVREREAQKTQTLAAQAELINAVAADVRDAYARVQAAISRLEVAKSQVTLAEEAMRIANVRYQGGVGTATEVSDTQASLTQARQKLVLAQTEVEISQAALDYATGTLMPPVVRQEAMP